MNVFSYIRVSSTGQLDGDGPERQREAIAKFCLDHGLDNHSEFVEAMTGTVFDRPVFMDMLIKAAAPGSGIQAIVVERLDRLARDLMVSEILLRECRDNGVKVFAVDQGQLCDVASEGDPTRTMMRQILAAVAQWEKTALVLKLKEARNRIKQETGRCGGVPAYGHFHDEIETKARILKRHAEGATNQQIADELNAEGIKSRSGLAWDRNKIIRVRIERTHTPKKKHKKVSTHERRLFQIR